MMSRKMWKARREACDLERWCWLELCVDGLRTLSIVEFSGLTPLLVGLSKASLQTDIPVRLCTSGLTSVEVTVLSLVAAVLLCQHQNHQHDCYALIRWISCCPSTVRGFLQ